MPKKVLVILASALVLCLTSTTFAATSNIVRSNISAINSTLMYQVRPGDTLNDIAASAHVTPSDIQILYQQNRGQLTPGDLLIFVNEYQTNDYTWTKYSNLLSKSSYIMTVQSGQTLNGIAAQYNVSPSDLVFLYRKSSSVVSPGDKLLLPVPKNTDKVKTTTARLVTGLSYQVQPGDSISSICTYLHMPQTLLLQLNPDVSDQNIRAGQMLSIGNVFAQLYTVKRGDTLMGIAQNFNASPTDIAVIYRSNPNYLNPGDKILINIQKWVPQPQQATPAPNSPTPTSSVGNQINYVSATYSTGSDNSFSSNNATTSGSSTSSTPLTQKQLVAQYSNQYNVNPNLIYAIIRAESGFNPYALSPANCYGLMQLSLPTARLFDKSINSRNIYNPETNIRIGIKYFKVLMNQFNNNLVCAIAAYNAGSQNVVNWLQNNPNLSISDIPFYATRQYVQAVLTFYNQYQQNGTFGATSTSQTEN
ncbi:MAG: transglycosylase SLT domain-containing protein [Fusobacteria bacterium]|nr:transglycosylase SLT domain-containing protein [Fusobacteriota bacterium]